jgi:hypothetical protein
MSAQTKTRTRRSRKPSRRPTQSLESEPPLASFGDSSEKLAFAQWMTLWKSVMKRSRAEMELSRIRRRRMTRDTNNSLSDQAHASFSATAFGVLARLSRLFAPQLHHTVRAVSNNFESIRRILSSASFSYSGSQFVHQPCRKGFLLSNSLPQAPHDPAPRTISWSESVWRHVRLSRARGAIYRGHHAEVTIAIAQPNDSPFDRK